jgi:hypothetical protein
MRERQTAHNAPVSRDLCLSTSIKRLSRSGKSAQDDKWSFCLTAGTLEPANQERPCRDDQTTAPEPHTGIQSSGGTCSLQGRSTLPQLAEQFDVHPNQITSWKVQLESGAADVFGPGGARR